LGFLEIRGVSKEFGGLRALDGVEFDIEAGKITSLIGPNGAGKTTLFNIISGLVAPTEGAIFYRDRRITGLAPHRIARSGVGRTFQDPRVYRNLAVLENVISAHPQKGLEDPIFSLVKGGSLPDGVAARSRGLLKLVGLDEKAGQKAWALSYGEQRFLSIARALATQADLLLMDEPTVGLDVAGVLGLKRLLRRLVDAEGKTVLLVEHNMDVVMDISDKVVLMVEGKVVAQGTPDEIKATPLVIEAYLGVRYAAQDQRS
jgi:ABC-type branched-subunit amino acid transport system ATPase component